MGETDPKKRLSGKVAVVTGSGHGIGRAEAVLLARQGAKVVVNDLGCDTYGKGADISIAQRVVDKIKGEGGEAVANGDTVATLEGAARIINTAIESFGRLDILVNNAGILIGQRIFKMTEDEWDGMVNTHLKGHFNTIKCAAPIFRKQSSGVIINTSSEAGLGTYQNVNYSAVKEGIVGLTRTIARELSYYNVRCNAIRPNALTRMSEIPEVVELRKAAQELGITLGNRPFAQVQGEIRRPEQVAVLVAWLCTDAAANINGRTIQVGNGEIGLYSEPEIIRSVFRPEMWNLDMLDSATCSYLFGDLTNNFIPAQLKK
jgi:3-oxoacyl-[acyl-carrier protein] reductase